MRQAIWSILFSSWLIQSGTSYASCDDMDVSKLQGRWVLESLSGQPVKQVNEVYFKVSGQTFTGFDGCNNFGGSLDAPSRMRQGQRGCGSEVLRLPLKILDPWPQFKAAKVTGDTLMLPLPDGKGEAGFSRK